jgi:16S rRNA (uracil1498-N3)-methyltransferase
MKQFILDKPPDKNGIIRLRGKDFHYLVRVRRLAPGECFPALLPGGAETLVRIRSTEGGVLTGECDACFAEAGALAPSPPGGREKAGARTMPPLILFQALPKGGKMDLIVRQAAEGGLAEVFPFHSTFSVPRLKKDEALAKQARWERIVKEARQQSGSSVSTAIHAPASLDSLFAYWEELVRAHPRALGLLFHQVPLEQASLHSYLDNDPELAALVIGPEGGFSGAEAARFLAAGFKPLTIGAAVLRTETAALYGAAAIRIILLEKDSWKIRHPLNGNG